MHDKTNLLVLLFILFTIVLYFFNNLNGDAKDDLGYFAYGDYHYDSLVINNAVWNPCIFWVEPQQFWYVNGSKDESYSITVSSMEVCGYINLRNRNTKTINICGGAKLHNISSVDNVTIDVDVYYSDGSYLWDQYIHFTADSARKCLIISGTKPISHILLALGSINIPIYSWATFSDVSVTVLPYSLGTSEVSNMEEHCTGSTSCTFSNSVPSRPSKFTVQPMFYMSTTIPSNTSITMVTQLSIDRLDRLGMIAERYGGPISAAVYVKNIEHDLADLREFVKASTFVKSFVDIHLLFRKTEYEAYPVNSLRNLATKYARSDIVFHNDVDFIPNIKMHNKLSLYTYNSDKSIYVVPGFEIDGSANNIPTDKRSLINKVKENAAHVNVHSPSHHAVNYEKWYNAHSVYKIDYENWFEPYVIVNRTTTPQFEELFSGYGNDKDQLFYRLNIMKYQFYVLPDVFTVHWNHETTGWSTQKPSIQRRWRTYYSTVADLKDNLPAQFVQNSDTNTYDSFSKHFARYDESANSNSVADVQLTCFQYKQNISAAIEEKSNKLQKCLNALRQQ